MDISLELLYYIASHNPILYYKLWISNKDIREQLSETYCRKLLISHNIGTKYKDYKELLYILPIDKVLKLLSPNTELPSRQLELGRKDDILQSIIQNNVYKEYIVDRFLNGEENWYNKIDHTKFSSETLEKIFLILHPDIRRKSFYKHIMDNTLHSNSIYSILFRIMGNDKHSDEDKLTPNMASILLWCMFLGLNETFISKVGYDLGIPDLYNNYINIMSTNNNINLYGGDRTTIFWRSNTNIIRHIKNYTNKYKEFTNKLLNCETLFEDIVTHSNDPMHLINYLLPAIASKNKECGNISHPWIQKFMQGYYEQNDESLIPINHIFYIAVGYSYSCNRNNKYDIIVINGIINILKNEPYLYKIFYMYLCEVKCIDIKILVDIDSAMCMTVLSELTKTNTYRYCKLYDRLYKCNGVSHDKLQSLSITLNNNFKGDIYKSIYANLATGCGDNLNNVIQTYLPLNLN
ncbi:Hypothetical protein ORPV_400 [Orpheovirus IHUMI-LCC2]|uniref:Uncharacterized protein n=1 Tax=Orpheovirus IHUMI-LCC2 TaxID=2023057 RepID=A0A2I2L445_9VIRU|nr:Hypothetical protein ORPV_400 [Orpheovirus IHUMI-LCC2]SNW62304.1 Hypothetical protein ORPV_400 [Orpheovirus IHUMI-LCC2]